MLPPAKILVVDDDTAVRHVLNRFLTGSGFQVVESADGVEAVERVRDERPDLVLLDVEMPRMDGWQALTELRRDGCRIPVLMLTNIDDVPSRVKGLDSGADDYVGKPCDLGELRARVNSLLRRSPRMAERSSSLQFGDVVVDLDSKSARQGSTPLHLTRTEFAVLELLASHRGKPVSRDLMLRVVWGSSPESNSHAVDTCLWRLRRKLGDDRREPRWIRNVPGIGYLLDRES